MHLYDLIRPMILMAPPDGAGDPPADPPAGAPADPPADPPAGAPAAAPAAAAAKWFESDKIDAETRDWLTSKGYAIEDATEAAVRAARGQREAEKKLGAGADALLQKPKEGQDVGAWLKQHGAVFGIPDAPDKYDLKQPEMPEGVAWDSSLEAAARAKAHELGLTTAQLQGVTELYAQYTGQTVQSLTTAEKKAEADLRGALAQDWGDQTDAKITLARQAASAMAEAASLDAEGLSATLSLLSKEAGDAGVMRLFAAIGEAMGEDGLKGFGKGATNMGLSPVEARQRLEAIQAPRGELAQARKANDKKAEARLQQEIKSLTQLAAGQS